MESKNTDTAKSGICLTEAESSVCTRYVLWLFCTHRAHSTPLSVICETSIQYYLTERWTSCSERDFRDFNRMQIRSVHGNQITILISTGSGLYRYRTFGLWIRCPVVRYHFKSIINPTPLAHTVHSSRQLWFPSWQPAGLLAVSLSRSLYLCCITLVHVCNCRNYNSDERPYRNFFYLQGFAPVAPNHNFGVFRWKSISREESTKSVTRVMIEDLTKS